MNNDYEKLLQYALKILSKKRYSSAGLREKLEQFFKKREMADKEEIEKAIARLFELKYLDDESYARDFVSDRVKFHPKGRFLLSRELKAKGIPKEMIEEILGSMEIDEYELAREALEKKMRAWRGTQNDGFQKQKNKAYRFLASRGFAPDAIYKAVDTYYNSLRK